MIAAGIFRRDRAPGITSAEIGRVAIIPTLVEVLRRHDQERLRGLDFSRIADHLEAIASRVDRAPIEFLRLERWPKNSVKSSLEARVALLARLLREVEQSGVALTPATRDLLENYFLEHVPYAVLDEGKVRDEGDHFVAIRDSSPPDQDRDLSLIKRICKWLGWSVVLWGSPPLLFHAAEPLNQIAPESEAAIELSPPAVAALIGGWMLFMSLVWWVTDRMGHQDLIRLHEFHMHSMKFQEAADEAISALGDSTKIEPILKQMSHHLTFMRMLRGSLQEIHRFRLDTGGDDPRILGELDQRIQDCQDLLQGISDSCERPDANIIQLADRRKSPKNGA